jgi:hypothetical protein
MNFTLPEHVLLTPEFLLDLISTGAGLLVGFSFLYLGHKTLREAAREKFTADPEKQRRATIRDQIVGGAYLFMGSLAVGGSARIAEVIDLLLSWLCPATGLALAGYILWRWCQKHPVTGQRWRLPGLGIVEVTCVTPPLVHFTHSGQKDEEPPESTLLWSFLVQGELVEPVFVDEV